MSSLTAASALLVWIMTLGTDSASSQPMVMFDLEEYEPRVSVSAPIGTDLFTAFFIINSSVTIGYLSFDIVDNMMVGESVSGSDFLINGTTPPVVISPPFESMYQLTISTGRVIDAVKLMDNITFNLHSFVNTTNGDIAMALASVVLHVTDVIGCQNVTCLNNGTCVEVNNNFTCQCAPGYKGRLCANVTNECDPDPCVNGGICIDQHLDYTCNCQQDFTGRNCSDTIDDCMSNPCQNNATCIDGAANYTCICPDGLTGSDCNTDIYNCFLNPCENNGTCRDDISGYTCDCTTGFTGQNCSVDIDYCSPNPCENNGTCTNLFTDYMCDCITRFTGVNCTSEVPTLLTALFDEDEYQSLIQVIAPTGTELFTAFFIINSSVTIGYLSFDIVDNMMVGESVSGSDFLINGTTPPVAISPPFESMYQLTISTGRVIDAVELMDNITFNLISYLNTTNGDTLISLANVTLYGKVLTSSFDPAEYESAISVTTPIGANLFTAIFVINSNITVSYLAFDLVDGVWVGEALNNGNFLINGTVPPLIISPPFETIYWLIISTGRKFDAIEIRENIAFNLFSYVRATNGDYVTSFANVILYGTGCLSETDVWGIEWPNTVAGDISIYSCYIAEATRRCSEDSEWQIQDVSKCRSQAFVILEMKVLENSIQPVVETTIEHIDELSNITLTRKAILPQDIITTNKILEITTNLTLLNHNDTDTCKTDIRTIANHSSVVLDNVLSDINNISFEQLVIKNSETSADLLNNIEDVGVLLARSLCSISGESVNDTIERNNIVLSALLANEDDLAAIDDIRIPDLSKLTVDTFKHTAQIIIPSDLITNQAIQGLTPVIGTFSRNINNRLPSNMENKSSVGVTLSSQLSFDITRNRLNFPNNKEVIVHFNIDGLSESLNTFCVFWDFEKGGWSTEGVATTQRNENFVQCSSSHLTSFAVLVGSVSGSENEEKALSYISYIGCGISITCLILTITTILLLKNKVFDGIQDFVHFNLSLSLTMGLITFVSGIEAANNTDVGCAIVAVILHYTFLAAFCWMLCEGAFLLTRFYLVLYEGFFLNWKFYTALGWGLPVPVVAISFGAAHRYYGSDQICWLSEDNGTIWAFIAPMLLIMLINFIFLCATLWKIYQSKRSKLAAVQSSKAATARSLIVGAFALLPILGTTWIIGLFAVSRRTIVFSYIFTIFNTFQGLFIFLFHVLRKKKFVQYMKAKSCKQQGDNYKKQSKIQNDRNWILQTQAIKSKAEKTSETTSSLTVVPTRFVKREELNNNDRNRYHNVSADDYSMTPPVFANSYIIENPSAKEDQDSHTGRMMIYST